MSQEFDDILALCLDSLDEGKMTLDECLLAYPEHADALRDLLATERSLRTLAETPEFDSRPRPEFVAGAKEQLVAKISAESPHIVKQTVKSTAERSWLQSLLQMIGGSGSRSVTTARYAIAGLAMVAVLSIGTIFASGQSLPGETLYPVKTSVESVQLNMANDVDNEFIDLQLELADRRLGEIEQLAAKETADHITMTSERYAEHLQATLLRIVDTDSEQSRESYKSQLGTVVDGHTSRLVKLEPVVAKLAPKAADSGPVTISAAKKAVNSSDVYIKTGAYGKNITRLSLMDVIRTGPEFSELYGGLQAEAMQDQLTLTGPYTVFVPTDSAIAELPEPWLEAMRDNARRRQTLLYHIVEGTLLEADLRELTVVETAHGTNLNIGVVDGEIILNGIVRVVETDLTTDNGVIHYIDKALIAPEFE